MAEQRLQFRPLAIRATVSVLFLASSVALGLTNLYAADRLEEVVRIVTQHETASGRASPGGRPPSTSSRQPSSLHVELSEIIQQEQATANAESMLFWADILAILNLCAYMGAIVTFCCWLYRAYRNLAALRVDGLAYSSGWAVGSFFVPFANLVVPFLVMKELWKGSDPAFVDEASNEWNRARGTSLQSLWWAAWLVGSITGGTSAYYAAEGLDATASSLGALSAASVAFAGVMLIVLVVRITKRQHRKWQVVCNEIRLL